MSKEKERPISSSSSSSFSTSSTFSASTFSASTSSTFSASTSNLVNPPNIFFSPATPIPTPPHIKLLRSASLPNAMAGPSSFLSPPTSPSLTSHLCTCCLPPKDLRFHFTPSVENLSNSPPSISSTSTRTISTDFTEDEELTELLENNGLGQYAPLFVSHEVDLKTFFRLKEVHLLDMGIERVGTRVKIMAIIADHQELRSRELSSSSSSTTLPLYTQFQTFSIHSQPIPSPPLPQSLAQQPPQPTPPQQPPQPQQAPLRPGEILFEEITFEECIGRGSFGSVFRGKWGPQVVAIKKLASPCSNEAEMMSKVRHRHVIQCYGSSMRAPNYVLVMECAERSLKQAIYDPATDINPLVVVEWACQIASGMNYLHTEAPVAIIHRDLKPGNVLMVNGILKVSDFGLSRVHQANITDKMSSVGTFEYMAPEIIRNEPYNERVDVFSFGVLVWEMLTRKIPYAGLPPLSVAFGVGSGTLKLPFPSKCPVSISALISKCLDRDHKKRVSFKEILSSMELLRYSDFTSVSHPEFLQLQKDWQNELGVVFETFKKDVDLLKKKQAELSIAKLSLDERERRLREREQNLNQNLTYGFVCRQTLRKYTEDIIGFGLSVIRSESRMISKIEFAPEYLSATAFFDLEVRHSMNHEMAFQAFLPIFITREHFKKSKAMLEDAFFCIIMGLPQHKVPKFLVERARIPHGRSMSSHLPSTSVTAAGSPPNVSRLRSKTFDGKQPKKVSKRGIGQEFESTTFHPDMALRVLCMLMNEVLVNAIKERFHPFKALEIFCLFHRLLLKFAEKYPSIIDTCDRQITEFISNEKDRHESEFPNLGEFLILFTLSRISWVDAVKVFIDEILQRSWALMIKASPELRAMKFSKKEPSTTPVQIEGLSDSQLVERTFNLSQDAVRVTLLHIFILNNISRYEGKSHQQIASQYDEMLGQPTSKMKEKAEIAFKELTSTNSFSEFFEKVGFSDVPLSVSQVSVILRTAAAKAHARKYFGSRRRSADDFVMLA